MRIVWKNALGETKRWLGKLDGGELFPLRNGDHAMEFKTREEVNRVILALSSTKSLWRIDNAWPHIEGTL